MSTIEDWKDVLVNSLNEIGTKIGDFLPVFLGALVIFILGMIVAAALRKLTRKVLTTKPANRVLASESVKAGLAKANIEASLADILAKVVYWVVMLAVLMTVSNILGLDALSKTIQDLLGYIPNVFAAAVVVALTFVAARLVRDIVTAALSTLNFSFTRVVSNVVYGAIILFGSVIAVSQLGLDTSIISDNVTVIVAGVMLTLAIAVGFGTRDLVNNIAVKHYAQSELAVGDKVTVAGVEGTVKSVGNLGVMLKTKQGDVLVPGSQLV